MDKLLQILTDDFCDYKDLFMPNSEFSSGGYNQSGYDLHEEIMQIIYQLMHKNCEKCLNYISIDYSFCMYCGSKLD